MDDRGVDPIVGYFTIRWRARSLLVVLFGLLSGCGINHDGAYCSESGSLPDITMSEALAISNAKAVAQGIDIEGYDLNVCYSVDSESWGVAFADKLVEIGGHFSIGVEDEDNGTISGYKIYTDRNVLQILELACSEVVSNGHDLSGYEKMVCFSPGSSTWGVLFSNYREKSFSELHVSINDHDLDVTVEVCDGVFEDELPPRCK